MNENENKGHFKRRYDMPAVFRSKGGKLCEKCGRELKEGNLFYLEQNKIYCLTCSGFDHLDLLPAGFSGLTRRANKYSVVSAAVLKWNRKSKVYRRQGILVEAGALKRAETELEKSLKKNKDYLIYKKDIEIFKNTYRRNEYREIIAKLYPGCPGEGMDTALNILCFRFDDECDENGKPLEEGEDDIHKAVLESALHTRTYYDEYIAAGATKEEAYDKAEERLLHILKIWKEGS